MDVRIQQALDGELSRDHLTREELAQLEAAEGLFRGIVSALPHEQTPDLSRAVLSQLGAPPAHSRSALAGAWSWLWQPHTVALRPAYALGGLAAIAALLLTTALPREVVPTANVATVSNAAPQILIQFRLDAPAAQQVSLAGDFTGWQPQYQMTRSDNGAWTIVVPLNAGVHEYAFIIDGERWVADPLAPAVDDGFGGQNSKLAVLAADNRVL
jgi:hypothetical protein